MGLQVDCHLPRAGQPRRQRGQRVRCVHIAEWRCLQRLSSSRSAKSIVVICHNDNDPDGERLEADHLSRHDDNR